jgi:cyanophycinase
LFLIGGGSEQAGFVAGHAAFADACREESGGEVSCVILAQHGRVDVEPFLERLGSLGLRPSPLIVSPSRPPSLVEGPIYVAGGDTPGYQEALCRDTSWLAGVTLYAGFSAGAAIAARRAVVGGWWAGGAPICDPEVGEGLHDVEIRPGLGLTEATVDVHCAQWGTLPRLIHAVQEGHGHRRGWGLDENTTLELGAGGAQAVHGIGAVWSVDADPAGSSVVVRRHLAGPLPPAIRSGV